MRSQCIVAAFIVAVVLVALSSGPPVSFAYTRQDIVLEPIAGSDYHAETFEYHGHTIAEAFAVSISAQLPSEVGQATQTKFAYAVAGLGDSWEEREYFWGVLISWFLYNPYVKEMWVNVTGDYRYTVMEDAIFDNTGTGDSSKDFLNAALTFLDLIFSGLDIMEWIEKVYAQPPVAEWVSGAHSTEAISRQGGWENIPPTYVPWLDPDEPRLQTAGANAVSTFDDEDGPHILEVTAGAEIYVQSHDALNGGVVQNHVGTYTVSFQVSVPVGVYNLQVDTYLMDDTYIVDVPVWVDGTAITGGSPVDVKVGYGTHTVEVESVFYRSIYMYTFDHWEGGSTSNPKTVGVYSDEMLRAYYARERIGNTPPVASNPQISPINPVTTNALVVSYDYSDADGDPPAAPQIRWFKDDVLQSAYNDQDSLPSSATAAGDVWCFKLRPNDGTELGDEVTSPSVTVEALHDVAVTDLTLSKTIVGQGFNMTIDVTVANQGDFSETFGVWLSLHIWPNYVGQVTLNPGEAMVLTYTWNTTAYDYGDYTISAFAEQVSGETDTDDNLLMDGVVLVTIPGDVDGDHDVDIFDMVAIQSAYNTHKGDTNYEPNYDIDGDGDVDIFDVVIAAGNYGQSW